MICFDLIQIFEEFTSLSFQVSWTYQFWTDFKFFLDFVFFSIRSFKFWVWRMVSFRWMTVYCSYNQIYINIVYFQRASWICCMLSIQPTYSFQKCFLIGKKQAVRYSIFVFCYVFITFDVFYGSVSLIIESNISPGLIFDKKISERWRKHDIIYLWISFRNNEGWTDIIVKLQVNFLYKSFQALHKVAFTNRFKRTGLADNCIIITICK